MNENQIPIQTWITAEEAGALHRWTHGERGTGVSPEEDLLVVWRVAGRIEAAASAPSKCLDGAAGPFGASGREWERETRRLRCELDMARRALADAIEKLNAKWLLALRTQLVGESGEGPRLLSEQIQRLEVMAKFLQ